MSVRPSSTTEEVLDALRAKLEIGADMPFELTLRTPSGGIIVFYRFHLIRSKVDLQLAPTDQPQLLFEQHQVRMRVISVVSRQSQLIRRIPTNTLVVIKSNQEPFALASCAPQHTNLYGARSRMSVWMMETVGAPREHLCYGDKVPPPPLDPHPPAEHTF